MTGTIKKYTKNFKMKIPEFNIATWHDAMEYDFTLIDSLLGNFFNTQKFKGDWQAVTEYHAEDVVYIDEEGSQYDGMIMKVLVDHVTDDLTFTEFYELHPNYYEHLFNIEQVEEYLQQARDWASKTDGKVEVDGIEVDYSSKAYATGGEGTEQNNAKYFKNLAQTAATNADSSASAASTSATNAHNSEVAAEISRSNARSAAETAISARIDAIQAKNDAQTAQTAAETASTNAQTAATSAQSSATSASTSATTATNQATVATNKANEASSSASSASSSAESAQNSATDAQTAKVAAETSATNAASSASSASSSATSAAQSKENAASSATSASASATIATQKATDAAGSATSASTSASTATTQAGIATTQATNAANSASAASVSATNAHTSETNAATSASNASISETNASNSATASSNSASTAAQKATESATSATSSANSAALSEQWAIGVPTEPEGGSAKWWAQQSAQGQLQADWTQTDNTKKDFIKNKPNIVNNTLSDSTVDVLAAAVGKALQEQINNLQSRGKYLSIWDCTTGLAMDDPPVNPYTYETGSFFIVGKVASVGGTNYKPNGATYDKNVPSTTIETGSIKVNDTYYYDGTTWRLLDVPEVTVAFSTLAGSPYDNTNLAGELNGKQPTLPSGTTGHYLQKTASGVQWSAVDALPSQSGQSGKFLTTNGTSASWGIPKTFNLLDFKWSDHELNDQSWLRADTFSWQDGTVYSEAYNTLTEEFNEWLLTHDWNTDHEEEGGVWFARTRSGYKICGSSYWETYVLNKYNTDGVAWFYILDPENTRFKLPRSTYNKYSKELPAKGNGKTLGLTNGTNTFGLVSGVYNYSGSYALGQSSSAYGQNVGGKGATQSTQDKWAGITTDATKSGIIASSVEDSNMKLYFYVGQFSQSATEQTAGLNVELFNQKADIDTPSIQAVYLKTTYVNGTSGYRIWSDGYCEQWGGYTSTAGTALTINFLKKYKDTNYNFISNAVAINAGTGTANWYGSELIASGYSRTVDSTHVKAGSSGYWKVCGYLASGQY